MVVGLGFVIAFSLVFLTNHVRTYAQQLRSLMRSIWELLQLNAAPKEQDVAVWEVRARSYRQAVGYLVHVVAFVGVALVWRFHQDQCFAKFHQMFSMFLVYLSHHAVLNNWVALSPANMRCLYSFLYGSFILFVLAGLFHEETAARAISNQGFTAGARLFMTVVFLHTNTAVPGQMALSLAETCVYACRHEHSAEDSIGFAGVQAAIAVGMTTMSVVLEYWVRSHISTLLNTESMLSSFRRMLQGLCDGELLLTADMKICGDAECLKHLLMNSCSYQGKWFVNLLMCEEVDRFQDFLRQSSEDDFCTRTPRCIRLSLLGSSKTRVAVDVWHVPLKDRGHLLALREDADARRPPPPTEHDTPSVLRSEGSISQSSWCSMLHSFPELESMTLLVDSSSHWFDVEQAHLSFQRQPQSCDFTMPSLRSLVRPTDWETVCASLKEIQRQGEGMMRLRLMDRAKRTLIANDVQVSTYMSSKGQKLRMNFDDLVWDARSPMSARDRNDRSLAPIEE